MWDQFLVQTVCWAKKFSWGKKTSGHILLWDTPDSCQLTQQLPLWYVKDSTSAGGQLWSNQQLRYLFCSFGIWLVGMSFTRLVLIQRLLGSRTPACRESFTGSPKPYPHSSEDDRDLRKGVKRKHSVLPESIECHEKWVAWLKWGLSPGKFLSDAPTRELKGTKVGWGSISCWIPLR